jgi:hypothetical protein
MRIICTTLLAFIFLLQGKNALIFVVPNGYIPKSSFYFFHPIVWNSSSRFGSSLIDSKVVFCIVHLILSDQCPKSLLFLNNPQKAFTILKGQCHEIFDPRFFSANNPP